MEKIPTISRTGILFRPGDYGKRGLYTDADIEAMAGDVNVPIRMSHYPTLLEGKLGLCERAFVGYDESGQKVLMGQWQEPQPLADLLGDAPRPLSVEIDLKTKKLAAVALEVYPQIKDAGFFSEQVEEAFAKFSRGEKVEPLDDIDNSAQETSIMSTPNETVIVEAPAVNESALSFMDKVKALFSSAQPEELAAVDGVLVQARTGKTPRELELEQKLAKFELDEAVKFAAVANAEAVAFADKMVGEKKIVAKGNDAYEAAVALFSIARHFDGDKPQLACFSAEFKADEFQAVDALTALFHSLPVHHKEGEQAGGLDPKDVKNIALFEQEKTSVTDPATGEMAEYSSKRAQEIIAARNGTAAAV